jgi:hypothetical protein
MSGQKEKKIALIQKLYNTVAEDLDEAMGLLEGDIKNGVKLSRKLDQMQTKIIKVIYIPLVIRHTHKGYFWWPNYLLCQRWYSRLPTLSSYFLYFKKMFSCIIDGE